MIKCACNHKDCLIGIAFDPCSGIMFMTGKDETESAFHLDPNSIAEIIQELKECLLYRVGLREED